MGVMRLRVSKSTWTSADMSTIVDSLVSLFNGYQVTLTYLRFDSPKKMSLEVGGEAFTYVNFNSVKADIDTMITQGGITVENMQWLMNSED